MAVTPEFESNWLEMQEKYGAGIDSGDVDPIDNPSQVDNTITIPVVKLVNAYVHGQDNEVQGYYYVPLKLFMDVVQADADAIESAWNTWFGEDSSHGVQGDWASLRVDVTTQTTAAQTAAGQAAAASTEWNNTYKPQVIQATTEASNVNAMLGSTGGIVTLTITNRDGTQTSKEVGFRIAMTCSSDEDMKTRAAGLEDGQFVMIASQVEPDNGKLYTRARNQQTVEPKGFSFIADLSGAQGIKGDTPVITADADGVIYSDGVKVTEIIKTTIANVISWLTTTQTTWNNWFSDSLSNGVRKKWNDFWTSINTLWNGFFGTSADDANGVRKIWSTWYNNTQTAWNAFWPAAKNTWESWFGTSTANGVQKQWADLKSDAQTQTQAAQSAASYAIQKGDAAEAQGNVAEQKGNTAKTQGDTAEGQGNAAESKGNDAQTKGNYAKTQGDYAKAWNDNPPFIGDGTTGDLNYWYLYDITTAQYVKSIYAKGDDLHWDDMSAAEKERLINEMLNYLETQGFDAVPTENSTKPVRSGGIYTALEEKEDKNNVASIQTCEDIIDELI